MEGVGWEIRPAGWILLILVAALLTYFIVKWLRRPPDENQEKA
jgi:hypothetical protein